MATDGEPDVTGHYGWHGYGGYNGYNTLAPPPVGTNDNPSSGDSANAPQSLALNVPSTDDYTSWNWETVLNGVLGLSLPRRNEVTSFRWTETHGTTSGDGGLFTIFHATWDQMAASDKQGFYVYLSPAVQQPKGPWDSYYNIPGHALWTAVSGDWFSGTYDPRYFNTVATALNYLEAFYFEAGLIFNEMVGALNSEASQFKGAAGGAFAQLVGNLNIEAQSMFAQLTAGAGYGGTMAKSGALAAEFVWGLWAALGSWSGTGQQYSPLGAILQALEDGGIIQPDGNDYILVPTTFAAITSTNAFGNLLSDEGWQSVENAAKDLWRTSVNTNLDTVANPWVNRLATSFLQSQKTLQPLVQPTMTQITPTNVGGGNLNGGGGGGGNLNLGPLNLHLDGLNPNGGGGFNGGGGGGGGGNLNGDGGFNTGGGGGGGLNGGGLNLGGLGDLGGDINSLLNQTGDGLDSLLDKTGGGLNTVLGDTGGGLNSLLDKTGGGLNSILDQAGGGGLSGGLNGGAGNLSSGSDSALQSALGDSQALQDALESALGLAPSSGPLHNALESALADNGKAQTAIDQALASGDTPDAASIQSAMADNKAAQAELQKALASAPKTGPLHDELESALADTCGVGTALRQALTTSGVPTEGSVASLASLLGGGKGLTANFGSGAGVSAGVGGGGVSGGASGAAGLASTGTGAGAVATGTSAPTSSGAFVAPGTATTSDGTSAVPFFPPMAGGGMGGAQQGLQERERTTWLAEDEDVWGTEPTVGPGVLGRDLMGSDDGDDLDYEEYPEAQEPRRRRQARGQTR